MSQVLSEQELERKREAGRRKIATQLRETMNLVVSSEYNPAIAKKFDTKKIRHTLNVQDNPTHGLTLEEMKQWHQHFYQLRYKFPRLFGDYYIPSRYDNRMRQNYDMGFWGRHTVHGKRHYFPLNLEVNHSNCVHCEKLGKET